MGNNTEKTYEMLWDCEYCGTQKLLEVSVYSQSVDRGPSGGHAGKKPRR